MNTLPPDDLGLFVIWPSARNGTEAILDDLTDRFRIIRVHEMHWTTSLTLENYRRFYSDLPLRGVYHQFNKGNGPFLAITLHDPEPNNARRLTSRGERTVNANFTDAKNRYRILTQGLNVHCSETGWETARDITMLLGPQSLEEHLQPGSAAVADRLTVKRDITGAQGWASTSELISTLRHAVNYVCLSGNPLDDTANEPFWHFATDDHVALHAVLNPAYPLYRPRRPWIYTVRIGSAVQPIYVTFDPASAGMARDGVEDKSGVFRPNTESVTSEREVHANPWWHAIAASTVQNWFLARDNLLIRARWLQTLRHAPAKLLAWPGKLWRNPGIRPWLRGAGLLGRGLLFAGRRFHCPVCNWRVRGFMARHGWKLDNEDGYCPRCNAKARHRRIWHFLDRAGWFFDQELRVLEIGPAPVFASRLKASNRLDYMSLDSDPDIPRLSVCGDARSLPFVADTFDSVLCHHVLEHVTEDRSVIFEIHRVIKPGGKALISVPVRLDQPTHEDSSVIDPAERARQFGEAGHVRWYGSDLAERLAAPGFSVEMHSAEQISEQDCRRFGLRRDEHLFICRKA